MKKLFFIIAAQLAYIAGASVGFIRARRQPVMLKLEQPDPPPAKIFVHPSIRTNTDLICLGRRHPDNWETSTEELFKGMAQQASIANQQHFEATGHGMQQMIMITVIWTHGRAIRVPVRWIFQNLESGEFATVLPGEEQFRLACLERAMRCFLN